MITKDIIKNIMAAGEVPLLIGEAGIGKTTIMHDIAKETSRNVIEIPLQVMDAEDFIGMVYKTEDGKFDFLLPSWFPTGKDGKVIIFLDEINRSTRRVRGALLKLVLEHQLNGHKLPKNTWIAAAMNPATDDYEVDEVMDQAFLSRFIRIDMNVDADDWIRWAKRNRINKNVVDFISENRHWLITKPKGDNAVGTNPRTWAKVSNLLNAITSDQIKEHGFEVLKNQIGMECARTFLDFIQNRSYEIKPEDVIHMPENFHGSIEKLPDDKKNVLLTRMVDYVLEKQSSSSNSASETIISRFINATETLKNEFNRENFAGVFRYITELAQKENDTNAQMLLEELSITEIGEDMYNAMMSITEE